MESLAELLAERLVAEPIERSVLRNVFWEGSEGPGDILVRQYVGDNELARGSSACGQRTEGGAVQNARRRKAHRRLKPCESTFGGVAPVAVEDTGGESGPVEENLGLENARPGHVASKGKLDLGAPCGGVSGDSVDAVNRFGVS